MQGPGSEHRTHHFRTVEVEKCGRRTPRMTISNLLKLIQKIHGSQARKLTNVSRLNDVQKRASTHIQAVLRLSSNFPRRCLTNQRAKPEIAM